MFSDKLPGTIAEHTFKFLIRINNFPVFGTNQKNPFCHIGQYFAMQSKF